MITRQQIEDFLSETNIAVAGASRDPKKFGFQVMKELKQKGKTVFPVNPETDVIDGDRCYRHISDLPKEVTRLLVVTPKPQTLSVLQAAHSHGLCDIWIQQMTDTPEAIAYARDNGMNLIHGKCILMFLEPVSSIHKFHRTILKIFGRLPK